MEGYQQVNVLFYPQPEVVTGFLPCHPFRRRKVVSLKFATSGEDKVTGSIIRSFAIVIYDCIIL